jgi:hypothetical protein
MNGFLCNPPIQIEKSAEMSCKMGLKKVRQCSNLPLTGVRVQPRNEVSRPKEEQIVQLREKKASVHPLVRRGFFVFRSGIYAFV